jgi:hypothetical protein
MWPRSPTDPGEWADTALAQLRTYLGGQHDSLNDPAYRERGRPIGTGRMESNCQQLVGVRLKGPGRHGTELGALAVTTLKAAKLNGNWRSFWRNLTLVACPSHHLATKPCAGPNSPSSPGEPPG